MTTSSSFGWSRTWDDEPEREDYVLIDNGAQVARAYRHDTSGSGAYWFWSLFVIPADRGSRSSRREAFLAAEEAYGKWRKRRG